MIRRVLIAACAVLLLVQGARAAAQDHERVGETQIKAAFLSKFGDFVEWPPAALAPADGRFTIGVLGAEPVVQELERVAAGRTVQGRPLAVRRVRHGESLDGLHVLFVGASESARLAEILQAASGRALLTVTESAGALPAGSMINFVPDASRVRFDIAPKAAARAELRISARLLAVARKVVS